MKETTVLNKTNSIISLLMVKNCSTTEISRKIELDYYKTIELLAILEKKNIIENIKLNDYNFWKLKGGAKTNGNKKRS